MIRTESVTKFYGRRCAVRDLSFEIQTHEVVGFLGLNGAGKSTTLNILGGLLAPSSGRVHVDGLDLLGPGGDKVRTRIGFLPERPPVYEDMTVRGYIDFAARLRGFDGPRTATRVDEVLHLTDLQSYTHEPISTLSHGYRQRVGIAQAIVHRPALVILDEPTSGLDPVQIAHMRDLIRGLKDHHTVLVSSHNLPEIEQTCDRLLVMRDGELVASGTEDELAARSRGRGGVSMDLRATAADVRATLEIEAAKGLVSTSQVSQLPDDLVRLDVDLAGPTEDLVALLVSQGVAVRWVRPKEAGLENLFMQLTRGKS